jgi:hypothetical protein
MKGIRIFLWPCYIKNHILSQGEICHRSPCLYVRKQGERKHFFHPLKDQRFSVYRRESYTKANDNGLACGDTNKVRLQE